MENDFQIENGILKRYTGRQESVTVPACVHTVGEDAFKGCASLQTVVLPAGLHNILPRAFKGCRRLREMEIPAGVTCIGDYAFHRCHSLESVSLPPSVKELGDCVFLYCDSLGSAGIPGVERLGKQVFVNDVMLEKLEISPRLREDCICDVFTGCSRISEISFSDGGRYSFPNAVEAVAGEMEVPPLVRAIAVDILRMMALEGRCVTEFLTNLKHVEIPEGVERIGKSAFYDKRGILSVSLPSTLREIESRAFRNCISLETVTFGRDQVMIHEDAFKNCSSLKELRTSDGMSYSMEGIGGLSGEEIPNLVRNVRKQILGNFRLSGSVLLKYLGSESRVVVPDGVTRIAEEAFAGNEAVEKAILPDTLEEIGAYAFRDCLLLQTVNFPEGLGYIGAGAFENCVKLLRVSLPDQLEEVKDQVFKRCVRLKELIFGENVRSVGEQAFYGCSSLREVSFPDSLVSLGSMAFYRCRGLEEVHLLPGMVSVGNLAFAQSGIKKVRMEGSGKKYGSDIFRQCLDLRTVVLEKGVRHIPHKLAYGCTALEQVILPDTLESVGRNVWEDTPFLSGWLRAQRELESGQGESREEDQVKDRKVSWGEEREEDREEDSKEEGREEQKEIWCRIFWDGRNLEGAVSFPEETRIVAGGAFYGNQRITSVCFPDHVTWVGGAALKGCTKLRHVVWPEAVATVEPEVFSGCEALERVVPGVDGSGMTGPQADSFPADILWEVIGERAFYNCRKLSYILWRNIRAVEKEAFCGCVSLTIGKADLLEYVGENAFEGVKGIGERPEESGTEAFGRRIEGNAAEASEERAVSNSKELSYLKAGDSAVTLSGLCFVGSILVSGKNCQGRVYIPEGITAIAPYAFSGNGQITEVILPDTLRHIGEGAFWGCGGLTDIRFPADSCIIGACSFEKCNGIRTVCLRARRIGTAAFAYCLSLEKAVLEEVSILENRLFEGCVNLEECICRQASMVGDYCFSGCKSFRSFAFPSIEKVGSYGFQGCDMLKEIALGDHTQVMPHGFRDCGRLERVVLTGNKGCPRLYEYALSGCTALEKVVWQGKSYELNTYGEILSEKLPEAVRLVFHSAFSCFEIEKEEILCGYRGFGRIVKIPMGIRRIQAEVFQDRLMLEQVSIPETVEYIGARAFHKTAWMERQREISPMVAVNHMLLDGSCCVGEVTVPEDIRLICGWAFAGGMGIEKIRFLSDRVKVEEFAFRNCIYLKELTLADDSTVILGGISDRKRELPALAKQAVMERLNCFKTDERDVLVECTGNISRLLVADGITAIGDNVFQDGNLLTEVILPRTVVSIGRNSFAGCKWLRRISGALDVGSIGGRAFAGCGSLEEVEGWEKLTEIGVRAFENCTSLKKILLPEGIEEIPDRAFFRCHSLQKVQLPSTLKRIGKEAFAFCKNLETPEIPSDVLVGERAFVGTKRQERNLK